MKATSDFTQKQMSTTQLSLLFCMPEKTGQFIAVMASVLVNSSRTASKSWLVRKGMVRSPQLRSCSIAKSSDTLQKVWSTCQLTASSKPLLMAYWQISELKDSEEMLSAPAWAMGHNADNLAWDRRHPELSQAKKIWCSMDSDMGKQA